MVLGSLSFDRNSSQKNVYLIFTRMSSAFTSYFKNYSSDGSSLSLAK